MVSCDRDGNVGLIVNLHNACFTSSNQSYFKKAKECFLELQNDLKVSAIVILGKWTPPDSEKSNYDLLKPITKECSEFLDLIENSKKPVIGAVQCPLLGRGLEMSLYCHYRLGTTNSRCGFPEVTYGLVPSCGGTQRFPRLVGLKNAIEWITSGNQYSAAEAAKIGLFDRIYPPNRDIKECAVEFARTVIGKNLNSRTLSDKSVKDAVIMDDLEKSYKVTLGKKSRGSLAPLFCLEAVCQSVKLPYHKGISNEQNAFNFLLASGQCHNLMHVLLSECSARKRIRSSVVQPRDIKSVAVIGLGTMGRGIAISLLRAGMQEVVVLEMNEKALQAGVSNIQTVLDNDVKKKSVTEENRNNMKKALTPANSYSALRNVDLVIEAVFESMQVKREVFSKLDAACKPSAILASNTSALDIDEIAGVTSRPQQVIGMHFFAPAHIMRLLENVRGGKTSPETIATAMKLGEKLNKVTVLVGNCHGFVGNRMFGYYTSESDFLLEEGAYPHQVDKVLKDYGFAMGRFQVADLSGNDIGYRLRQKFGLVNKEQPAGAPERERYGRRYCPLADFLVESGQLGLKTGRGWYNYAPKQREPMIDQSVIDMIDRYRSRNNIQVRKIKSQEVLERMLYPLINEGFNILEEGIADDPFVIDLIFIHGYGWPRYTGGPMHYAHTIGLPRVLEVMEQHWNEAGMREPHWQPSKMLVKLVKEHGNPEPSTWTTLAGASTASSRL